MRTMLTLDDQIAKSLQERAHQTHQSFFAVKQQQRPVGAVLAAKAVGTVPAAIAGKPAPTDE
ncbi:MAG: hypothetical protein H7842_14680 [Gammaproteobacteria bacterium SHHR-1]